jgi:hypothetical protein
LSHTKILAGFLLNIILLMIGQTDFNTAKHKNHSTAANHKNSSKNLPLENGDGLDPISDEEDYLYEFPITSQTEQFQYGKLGQILNLGDESLVLKFRKEEGEYSDKTINNK